MKMEHGLKTLVLKLNLLLVLFLSLTVNAKTLKLDALESTTGTQDISITTTADIVLDSDYVLVPTGNFNDATIRDVSTPTTDTGIGISGTTGTVYTLVNGSQKMAVNTTKVQFFSRGQFLLSPQSNTSLGLQLGETGVKNTGFHAEDSDADLLLTADSVDVMQLESTQGIALLPMVFNDDATFETSLILEHIATPSNPSSGSNKLYTKSDDKLYLLDSSGTETEIGAGGGGGAPYTAKVSSTGVVSDENTNWISGNCVVGGGRFTCATTGSPFTIVPVCQVSYNTLSDTDGNIAMDNPNSTSSSIVVFPSDASGGSLNTSDGFNLTCQE